MKTTRHCHIVQLVIAAVALAAPAFAQQPAPLPIPPQLEKDLATRAADVTEVTLNKNMLAFATQFMHNRGPDEAATRQLIEGLDGIYVREYEFDKEGQYSPDEIDQLRKAIVTPEWSPIIHEHERRSGETSDVMVKMVNGENKGLFILAAEPKELTIVLILGPIQMQDLGKLRGITGLGGAFGPLGPMGALGPMGPLGSMGPLGPGHRFYKNKDKDKDVDQDKDKSKDKDKDKTGGDQ